MKRRSKIKIFSFNQHQLFPLSQLSGDCERIARERFDLAATASPLWHTLAHFGTFWHTLAHFGTLRQSALGTCETIHKILHSCTLEKISAQISLKYASVKPICAHSWTFIAGSYFMEHDYLVIFHKLHTSCKRN